MKIKNVSYTIIGHGHPCLACECNGARYHVWIGKDGKPQDNLYKNSEAAYGQPGYHPTRKLSTTSTFGKKLIASMQEIVEAQDLVRRALEKAANEEAQRRAEDEAEYKIHLQRQAGPALYKCLEAVWELACAGKVDLPGTLASEIAAALMLAEKTEGLELAA